MSTMQNLPPGTGIAMEVRIRMREIKEDDLDETGKMMLNSARVFSAAGTRISPEYLGRLESRRKSGGWPDA